MRCGLLILLVILSTNAVFGQNTLDEYYSQKDSLLRFLDVSDIRKSEHNYVFRFIKDSQILEVWIDDPLTFGGQIITHTQVLFPNNDTSDFDYGEILFQRKELSSVSSIKIFNFLIKNSIDKIKYCNRIPIVDGASYEFHYKKNSKCYGYVVQKGFWNNCASEINFEKLISILENRFFLKETREKYFKKLPSGCYKSESYFAICK